MKIISWNVNGLRAVIKKNFMEYISDDKTDILCIQETKLQEEQIPQEILSETSYNKYWSCAEKKGYSGVAIFTREVPTQVTYSIGEDRFDREGRTIIAEFRDFTLINCYFPNGQMSEERLQFKLDFYDRMLKVMNEIVASGKNLIICGDFNTAHQEIDLAHPKENSKTSGFLPVERAWLDKLVAQDYIDTFRHFDKRAEQYSWWTYRFGARSRNIGWRIDYFFVNKQFMPRVKSAFIRQDVMGSDHCPVGMEVE
ncbi:MAG: exodeoxyribonuclease III [Candidatus Cloacimonas sp. SDB]|nr:MAG: exodeoxyribonuclease III [Candidatus Cloacimonas sp. SDB]